MVGVRGRADDAVNHGRLGPKGLFAGWQGVSNPDRLTRPLVREHGKLVETDWDTAMSRIVAASRALLEDKGPLSHAFYTSGQLFLEEYYALAIIGKAGIGTPHMDGNTRLCTATAASALKESFGSDGQPGCYADIDNAEAIFLYGHNMAETQTVLWSRVLDRLSGPQPPQLVCIDPRETEVARHAELHLAPHPGTNLALMHWIVREVLANDWIDGPYLEAHTLGLERLRELVWQWTPEAVERTCGVPADGVRTAARIFGTSTRVLSTVLQGFYEVLPGHRRVLPGQQPAPAARDDRPSGCRHPADEWPTHGAKQPRMRCRRRPARLPQLGECSPCGRTGRVVERGPGHHPALGASHARDADPALRRAGLRWVPLGFGDQPGDLHARAGARAQGASAARALPGGPRPLPHRNRQVRRRGVARRRLGRKNRHLHQRGPHRAPLRAGRVAAGDGAQRPGDLPGLFASHGIHGSSWGAVAELVGSGRRVQRVARSHAGPAGGLHGHGLCVAAFPWRHPVALQRRRPGGHGAALHRRGVPHRRGILRDLRT